MPAGDGKAALFAEHRAYLFAVAYRLLGVAEDAEDVLQDAWLRLDGSTVAIEAPRAYLVKIVTRLSIDLLRSARRRREEYTGIWLPEPVATRDVLFRVPLPADSLEQAESASFAFLLLLERLSPLERAVLVLHDVFDYSHAEIAGMIGRNDAACRQILRRARRKLGDVTRPKAPAGDQSPTLGYRMVAPFLEAVRSGNVERFLQALAPDVVLMSDGGGQVAAVRRPLAGRSNVGRFLAGVSRKGVWGPVIATELNARPALLVYQEGSLTNAVVLDVTNAGVTAVYVVRNPDKLSRLARDARELGSTFETS